MGSFRGGGRGECGDRSAARSCGTQMRTGAAGIVSELMIKPPGSATIDDFDRLDLRVGRILEAAPLEGARRPAYRLVVDLGPHGTRRSSAQLATTYPDPAMLVGRLVVAVVNFSPRRIAGFESEVLVLGALPSDGRIPLLGVDEGARPGDPVG
jgi:tRNA-binding protein